MNVSEIEQLEERLRVAMLASDAAELDGLVSDRLLFVTPDGGNVNKAADLEAQRSGRMRLSSLMPLERHIEIFGTTAIVNVEMSMAGSYARTEFSGRFRYTRIWHFDGEKIQVVAGHVCAIQ